MRIIHTSPSPGGSYMIQEGSLSALPDGCAMVPDDLDLAAFYEAMGFIFPTFEENVMTGYTVNQEALNTWNTAHPAPSPSEELEVAKEARIAKSKADLADYLEAHPLQWTDGEYYAITAEKQQQLTSKLMAASMAQQTSTPYTLTWNSTGEVCKAWTLEELSALAFAIDARVTALVTYQQTQEVAMRDAENMEALEAIVVDYDSVGAAA